MKKWFSGFLGIFCFCLCSSLAQAEGLIKITDRVYSYADVSDPSPGNSFGSNAGIVIGDKGILVVDSLVSAKEAKRLVSDIRKISDKPIRYVVNTHSHFDHTFGNAEFASLGAVILAQDTCAENMRKSSEHVIRNAKDYGISAEEAKDIKIAYPNVTFADKTRFVLGGVSVELLFIAPSHTSDSIIVFIPEEKVAFSGDILFTDYHPYMGDGDIEGWVKTLDHLMTLDAEKIIPGHGPVSTKKDVAEMKKYILAFDKTAKDLSSKSNDIEYVSAEVKKAVPARSRGDFLIPGSLQAKYLKGKN